MSRVIVIDTEILQSGAFLAICRANSIRVLLEFYRRRKIHKPKDRRGKHSEAVILNNGDLTLTYRDAIQRLRISQATYSRCLTELVDLGFLDIAELSSGLNRQPTKWSLSDRWKLYGQPDFVPAERKIITPPFARKRKTQLSDVNTKTG